MTGRTSRTLALPLAGAAAMAIGGAAAAAVGPNRNATANALIYAPLVLKKDQDLDFGKLTVTTAGTAVLDPNSGALSTTGGVIAVGGTPQAALFEGIAPTGNVVIIRLPKTASTLTRVGGTQTMTVDTWTLDGTSRRNISSKVPYTFKVGGTLHAGANQLDGIYMGTFTVDVQYP